jgi:lipid-binding SYLF domain-containing protein
MTATSIVVALMSASVFILAGCQTTGSAPEKKNLSAEQIQERRTKTESMATSALEKLYAENPQVKGEIEKAAGYGVFDVATVNVVLIVGASGPGMLVNNKSKKKTFMRALRAGTGPGVGYQELYQIFVFKTASALEQFAMGDKAGGDVSASVTAGTSGKQYSFNPNITVYQLSEKGFAIQANWGGTGYIVDPDLN